MRFITLIFLILLLGTQLTFAQYIQRSVIGNAGQSSSVDNKRISWTIGETSVKSLSDNGVRLTQGVQQPEEAYTCPTGTTVFVTNTNDSGQGSLRAAIECANADVLLDTILFDISGGGMHVIEVVTELPNIDDDSIVIDGTSLTGWKPGSIIIDGSQLTGFSDGMSIWGDHVELYGLYFKEFQKGINLYFTEGCQIGDVGKGNITTGNASTTGSGIVYFNVTNCHIRGNTVGIDAEGNLIGNYNSGIAPGNDGGINLVIDGNVIGGITNQFWSSGIAVEGNNIVVSNNIIGTDTSETKLYQNNFGITIAFPTTNVTIENNVITNSFMDGINLWDNAQQIRITNNSIYCNDEKGIEILNGGNNDVTAPIIQEVSSTIVIGTSAPFELIEVFQTNNTNCSTFPCQGKTYLGTTTADAIGNWALNAPFNSPVNIGDQITATATDSINNTSEFSNCQIVQPLVCNPTSDSLELAKLYTSINPNGNWTNNWLTQGLGINNWDGITTNADGCVISIVLSDLNIDGALVDLNLPHLEVLSITRSNLVGQLPSFSQLPNLRELNLGNNNINGVVHNFPNLPFLEIMDIDSNNLEGNLPQFDSLPNLTYLDFNTNQISGNLPDYSHLDKVYWMDFTTNNLSGNLPNFSMPALTFLGLGFNQFDGNLPNWLGMPLLESIFINNNDLSGPFPDLDGLSGLSTLVFEENKFTFDGLEYQVNKGYGSLSYSPQDSVYKDTTIFTNEGEQLLIELDFDDTVSNNIYSWYRNDDFYTTVNGVNDLSINPVLSTDAGQYYVHVTNSNVSGLTLESYCVNIVVNPVCRFQDSLTLVTFYNAMHENGTWTNEWDLNQPMDTWWGVGLNPEGCVECLDLDGSDNCFYYDTLTQGNNLRGILPDEIGNLSELRQLLLRGNSIYGSLPNSIGDLNSIVVMDISSNELTGSIPTTLVNLSELYQLDLSLNALTGNLPTNIGFLPNLQTLFLDSNQLDGNLPPGIGSLSNLEWLGLSQNNFTGSIPIAFGALLKLIQLKLYDNQLSGEIPQSLGNITTLTTLHAANNNLTGNLPAELGNLTNITCIDFRNNQLEGCFPNSYQIFCPDNIASYFEDNADLPGNGDFTAFCNDGTGNCDIPPCVDLGLFIGNDTSLCLGNQLTLQAGNFQTYQWNTGSTSPSILVNIGGNYSVTVGDGMGCTSMDEINVFIDNPDLDDLEIEGDTICFGEEATLGLKGFFQDGFTLRELSSGVEESHEIFPADLDGDGDIDVVSADLIADRVGWYENLDSEGTFGAINVISTNANNARSVFAIDVDGDNDLDVISASKDDFKVAWYENLNGTGSFGTERIIYQNGQKPLFVYGGDLDGDNDTDVIASFEEAGLIYWFENQDGVGNFGTENLVTDNVVIPRKVIIADINGDGNNDIISASGDDDKIAWFNNQSGNGGIWIENVISNNSNNARYVHARDWDDDGDIDILSVSSSDDKIAWFENQDGFGNFSTENIISNNLPGVGFAFPIDLDRDSDLDVVATGQNSGKIVWYQNVNGSFGSEQIISDDVSESFFAYPIDLDQDGDIDILSKNSNGEKVVWYEQTQAIKSPFSLTYLLNGDPITETSLMLQNDSILINVSNLDEGIHSIQINQMTDENGCQYTPNLATGILVSNPEIDLGNDASICDGSMLTIDAGNWAAYQWTNGFQTQTIDIDMAGTYGVTVTDDFGCTDSDEISISIAPEIQTNLEEFICLGDSFQVGDSIFTESGMYQILFTGVGECDSLVNLELTVIDLEIDLGNDTTICDMEGVTLDATNPNCQNCMYEWDDGSDNPIRTDVPSQNTIYWVILTDERGCTFTDSIQVFVQKPVVSLGGDKTICEGDSETLDAGSGWNSYLWNTSAMTQTIDVTTTGIYSVTVTDNLNCPAMDEVEVFQSEVDAFAELKHVSCFGDSDGEMVIHATQGLPPFEFSLDGNLYQMDSVFTNLNAQVFTIFVRDAYGCEEMVEVEILEPQELELTLFQTLESCEGKDENEALAIVSGGTLPYQYSWSDGQAVDDSMAINLPSGNIFVTITDANDCEISSFILIEEKEHSFSFFNGPICESDLIEIGGFVFDINNPKGSVIFEGEAFNGCDSIVEVDLDFLLDAHSAINERLCPDEFIEVGGVIFDINNPIGTVVIDGQAANGCDLIVDVELDFIFPETESFEAIICEGETYEFNGEIYNNEGIYIDTLKSFSGCDSLYQILDLMIEEVSSLEAENDVYEFSIDSIQMHLKVTENDFIQDAYFLDNISEPTESGEIEILNNETILFTLTKEDFVGIDSFRYAICAENCPEICDTALVQIAFEGTCVAKLRENLSSAFSPNNDGINDIFDPLLFDGGEVCFMDKTGISIMIVNRWGEVVFNPDEYEAWTGLKSSGNSYPQGTYYVVLTFPREGEEAVVKGPLTLLH